MTFRGWVAAVPDGDRVRERLDPGLFQRRFRKEEFRHAHLRGEVFIKAALSLEVMREVGGDMKIGGERKGDLQMPLEEIVPSQGGVPQQCAEFPA